MTDRAPNRRELVLLVSPIIALSILALVGAALTPTLATTHPLALLVLDARNRTLVLVAKHVDLVPLVIVAVLRRLLSDPIYYVLGRRYGDRAVRWIEGQVGGRMMRVTQSVFRRAAYPMVFAFPGALVCALAGQTGMSALAFGILNVTGTVVAVITVRLFGTTVLAEPVDAILDFFGEHRLVTTLGSASLVLGWVAIQKVRGRLDTVSIDELGAELSEVEEGVEPDSDAPPGRDRLDGAQDPGEER